jgi:lysine 6-dehydrogenase
MGFRYVVLGAGRQGLALAFDLAKNGEAERVRLLDGELHIAQRAVDRLHLLLPVSTCRFEAGECDAADAGRASAALEGSDVALSAVPYRFNAGLAAAAVEAGASFLDLGGNTSVVRAELALHERAVAAGVSVVPDCGLAPGLGNHLAAHGVESLDTPQHVHVRCGGLPEKPVGPLAYKMLFNFFGLWNEYRGNGEFLRGGKRVEVPALTESESIDFGGKLGVLEAVVTSGGTSTCPEMWLGKLESYDYKTLRYPGHWEKIRTLFALGFFDEQFTSAEGRAFEPLVLTKALFEDRLAFPEVRDITVLRTTVSGRHRGKQRTVQYDYLEHHDPATGFTAMERGTAFPAALVAHLQARRLVAPGARPLEVSVPAQRYFDELPQHDIRVKRVES